MITTTSNTDKKSKNSAGNKAAFPKPNWLLYNLLALVVRMFLRIKTRPSYNLGKMRHLKGPAIIMCTHTSNLDFLTLAVALAPLTPTYIMSNHFFVNPKSAKLVKPLHAIPKKMFCADVNAVRQIIKAIKAGNVVVMFPEGRLSCCGHTMQIADGTAELVKKLGVDVYWVTMNGAYKAMPKWGKAGIRRGPVSVDGGLLWRGAELTELSVSDIEAGLRDAIAHDDETAFVGIEYHCKNPALGLDRILYKCPVCGEEFKMKSDAHTLLCTACGSSWELSPDYVLRKCDTGTVLLTHPCDNEAACDNGVGSSVSFCGAARADQMTHAASINSWFDWEQEMIDLDAGLECDCKLATPDKSGILDRDAGFGHIKMDRETIHYEGTCWGEPFEFTERTDVIKAFPATVGDHFDIYSNKIMYNIIPQPNPAEVIKWVQYLDKLNS